MTNPFDLAGETPADTNPFEGADATRHAVQTAEHTWTEAETCEVWGGCEQHPVLADAPAEDDDRVQAALNTIDLEHAMVGRANGKNTALAEVRAAEAAAPTNRAAVVQAIAAHEAAAKALKEMLNNEARAEYDENGTRVNWDLPGLGRFTASIDQEGAKVGDQDAWIKYARKRWPDEIVMVPTFRNPEFQKQAIAALAGLADALDEDADADALQVILSARAEGKVLDDELNAVPGLVWERGGTFRSASLYLDSKVKRRVAEMAKKYAAGAGPLEIEGGA